MTGYLVLTKGEASWARRGRFANILAVDDPISFGRSDLGGDGWHTGCWSGGESPRLASRQARHLCVVLCQLSDVEQVGIWEVAGLGASRMGRACNRARAEDGKELTAGVERSLLIAIVGAMVETGSGLMFKTRQRCVPVGKKLALQVVCVEVWPGRWMMLRERSHWAEPESRGRNQSPPAYFLGICRGNADFLCLPASLVPTPLPITCRIQTNVSGPNSCSSDDSFIGQNA